jgi:predicted RNA-binding Zn-ribbon protein involved in translation (DUF1610 family)
VNLHHPYSEAAWEAESKLTAEGGPPLPCPDCGSYSNYGPKKARREDGSTRYYRACKMCGFWQEADGSPAYRCWASQHLCVRHVGENFTCDFCGSVLVPQEAEGPVAHTCGKYLLPSESGYHCTTCGRWYGRESQVPWPMRGSG